MEAKMFNLNWTLMFPLILVLNDFCKSELVQTLYTTEPFYTAIAKRLPGSSKDESRVENIEVLASLAGYADLPRWMFLYQSASLSNAYLYGVPPAQEDGDIDLDVVLLNTFTYDTTREHFKYTIHNRNVTYKTQLEMTLFDLNIIDCFTDPQVPNKILAIFTKLWTIDGGGGGGKSDTVYLTAILRPIDVPGGRFPLDPNEKEGVVIRIGALAPPSKEIAFLVNETLRLHSHRPCPRKFKATSVEHLFRQQNLLVDWCSFKLLQD